MTPRRAGPERATLAPLLALLLAAVTFAAGAGPRAALAEPSPTAPEGTPAVSRAMYRIPAVQLKRIRPLLGLGLDVAGRGPQGSLDLILTPEELGRVRGLGYEPIPIDLTARSLHGAPASPTLNPTLGDYHTVAEARSEMIAYVAAHPSIARLDSIGTSVEGRSILAVEISDNVGAPEGEPEVLIAGCHHARELMTVEIPLYVMRRLLDGYGTDPVITDLVDTRDIWIIPIVNPDGHVYVEEHSGGQSDGWWRKNRRVNGDGSVGVDLNRNYGYEWGYDDYGSSPTPSSEVYRGTGPFSEPETAAIRDFMASHAFTTSASFHSYGDLLLYPWGYAPLDTPDRAVFRAMGDSISAQNGYLAGNPKSGAIYLTNGEMCDWEYGETALKPRLFGFTFEVNTAGEGGFDPNDALIGPTCDLNWGPILTLLRYADAPRRIVGPARPTAPTFVQLPSGLNMQWTYVAPDADNPPVRHDVRRVDQFAQGVDDAEAGPAAWDTVRVEWSTDRSTSGTHSYHTGDADNETATLTGRVGVDVAPGDSLVVWAWWDLEQDYDYWYAEASVDEGRTWTPLPGDWTSPFDPFGYNEGNGVSGTSGGIFRRATFALAPFAGLEPLLRFRCVTDLTGHGDGLYLDDISHSATESGVTITDTQSAADSYTYAPIPAATAWFQIRAVDPEGQAGSWGPRSRFDPAVSAVDGVPVPSLADRLGPSVPNPFNPGTEVRFDVGEGGGPFRLDVFDASGRLVRCLAKGVSPPTGTVRAVRWNGEDSSGRPVGSGVYLLRLETPRGRTARKAVLLR
jgi:carboxypeptidase T